MIEDPISFYTLIPYLISTCIFFVCMYVYFMIARRYKIYDTPNERSSHSEVIIRGGGIIFLIAAVNAVIVNPDLWMVSLALLIIGVVSFIDDRISLSSGIRASFHFVAVSILFLQLNMFGLMSFWVVLLYILVIGIINAYNFMDGINGITGIYSLTTLASLQYVNYNVYQFINPSMIWLPILATAVFLYFNFRSRAKCFAGDVGSITIALWVVFLLLLLVRDTFDISYLLFLTVYGIDSVLTIIQRLILRQRIFDPHRLHLYQLLANEQKVSHLVVALMYGIIQLFVNCAVLYSGLKTYILYIVILLPLGLAYIYYKKRLMLAIR